MTEIPPSAAGLLDARVCVPGGVARLGDPSVIDFGAASGLPERPAVMSAFYLDKHEVTVGRFRDAKDRGFVSPDPTPLGNIMPLAFQSDVTGGQSLCTYSDRDKDGNVLFPERETMPLTCVSFAAARALCRFWGGDLPSIAQREHAGSSAGRSTDTAYPWGDDPPGCDGMAYGAGALSPAAPRIASTSPIPLHGSALSPWTPCRGPRRT
jgi:formylglycine-generating enzyme required for sulfatase activity